MRDIKQTIQELSERNPALMTLVKDSLALRGVKADIVVTLRDRAGLTLDNAKEICQHLHEEIKMSKIQNDRAVPRPTETTAYTDVNGHTHGTYGDACGANARQALRELFRKNSTHEQMEFEDLLNMIEENRELMTEIVSFLGKIKK